MSLYPRNGSVAVQLYMVVIASFQDEAAAKRAADDANTKFQDRKVNLHAEVLPLPAVDQVTPLSPCVLAHAMNSAMLLTGRAGFTTMTDGATAIMPTGTRSEFA